LILVECIPLYSQQIPEKYMRGVASNTPTFFSYVDIESRIPSRHPLRKIKSLVHEVLASMDTKFNRLYSAEGRPSIPPEQLLCALLLQVFFGVRSERQLMEQMEYNLLYRWFVGVGIDDAVWDVTVFTKNRDRLLDGDIAADFLQALLAHKKVKPLLSDEHFSVDGTLIEAWTSHKSFQPKDGGGNDGGSDFHGEKRCNETHASVTDPDARLYKKSVGKEAKLAYMGHACMENRHGLAVGGMVTHATGKAEREASEAMLARYARRGRTITVGEDKAYDTEEHVENLRKMGVTPHVAQNNKGRRSNIDGRTTRHTGYKQSCSIRARIECIFGYGKQAGTMRKTKHRGLAAVACDFLLNLISYNLVRIPKILETAG
jgi:transposase